MLYIPDHSRVRVLHDSAHTDASIRVLLAVLLHHPHDDHDLSLCPNGAEDSQDGHVRQEHRGAWREQAGAVEEGNT